MTMKPWLLAPVLLFVALGVLLVGGVMKYSDECKRLGGVSVKSDVGYVCIRRDATIDIKVGIGEQP